MKNSQQHIKDFKSCYDLIFKIPVFMRITIVLLFIIIFQAGADNLYSQSARVSLNMRDASVEEVLNTIEEESEFYFLYNSKLVNVDRKVSVNVKSQTVEKILDRLFASTDVIYKIEDRQIILSKKEFATHEVSQGNSQDNKKIKGIVVDESGEPVIGATIVVPGTTNGAPSDVNGEFTMEVPQNAELRVSYIGYITQTVSTVNKTNLRIVLKEDMKTLDEVVIVGYGTMEKRAVTSSISSVKADELASGLTGSTIGTVLRGKVSGLSISGNDSPNSETSFQLRGIASINSSQGPLVVIDGVPGGDMRALNQEDIATIDVLKDASAGAIYGTRATGGVILITTKQAKEGPMKIGYKGELMIETTRRQLEMLNAKEFVEAGLGTDYGHETDWFDVITRTPVTNRHILTMSGGSQTSRVYSSFSYQDMQGLSIGDSRRDYNGRINTEFKFFDNHLEIRTHSNYRHLDRREEGGPSIFEQALLLNPTETPYDDTNITGYNIMAGQGLQYNPLARVNLRTAKSMNKYLTTDGVAKVNILPELYVQGTIGYQVVTNQQLKYTSANDQESVNGSVAGNGYHKYEKAERISAEAYVNYNKTFAESHNLNAVIGHSFEEVNKEYFELRNRDFPVDNTAIWDIGSGLYLNEGKASMASNKDARDRLASFFGRANYSFDNKYMATATIRHEGSSKFGPNNRWGTFWSLSGGWRISKEKFMENLIFINDLKVRAGYGIVGNNGFQAGLSVPMYSSDNAWWNYNGMLVKSYGAKRNVNPDLKWEEKKEWNIGLDYSLFNDRLYGKFDYYIRKVEGMIYAIAVPQPPNVYGTTLMNGGDLENKGWEFEIGADIVRSGDWNYSTTMRFSQNKSTINNLGGSATYQDRKEFPSPGMPGYAVRLQPGSTIGQYFLFKHAGFDENGDYLIYDKNNNVIPVANRKEEDKRYIGNAMPKLIIAWDHTVSYKNWDMTVYMRSHLGQDAYNMIEMYYGVPNVVGQNVLKDTYEKNKQIKGGKQLTDYYLEKASFFKIDAVNIGYNLNLKKYSKYLGNAKIYGAIRDVLCITGYKGLDPEVNTMGLEPGFDDHRSYYPKMRRFTFGVQLDF